MTRNNPSLTRTASALRASSPARAARHATRDVALTAGWLRELRKGRRAAVRTQRPAS